MDYVGIGKDDLHKFSSNYSQISYIFMSHTAYENHLQETKGYATPEKPDKMAESLAKIRAWGRQAFVYNLNSCNFCPEYAKQ